MADKKQLQAQIKGLLDQSRAIETAAGDKAMTPEQLKSYQDINTSAWAIKEQIDALDKADALKGWAGESDGQSAVRAGFSSPDRKSVV
jgi:hypothetical protein